MGKKAHGKESKKKLTKKEKKQLNHLKLIQGGKSGNKASNEDYNQNSDYKKSA